MSHYDFPACVRLTTLKLYTFLADLYSAFQAGIASMLGNPIVFAVFLCALMLMAIVLTIVVAVGEVAP